MGRPCEPGGVLRGFVVQIRFREQTESRFDVLREKRKCAKMLVQSGDEQI
jgi:hypothetical protein